MNRTSDTTTLKDPELETLDPKLKSLDPELEHDHWMQFSHTKKAVIFIYLFILVARDLITLCKQKNIIK